MSANNWIKFLSFATLGGIVYFTFSTPPTLRDFEHQLLSHPSNNEFRESFEDVDNAMELFQSDFSRWHQLTLQNNELKLLKNPTKNCFIQKTECAMPPNKNNLVISNERKRRGDQSLKVESQPTLLSFGRRSAMGIRRHLFEFGEGDDAYFSGWFYLESEDIDNPPQTRGLTFMGLRAAAQSWRYRKEPGRFFMLERSNYVASDLLYWLPKPEIYKQEILEEIGIPFNKWVNLRFHIKFSNSSQGLVEIWQDSKKILYRPGQTLPQAQTVYSILELGVLNHEDPSNKQTLYLDEIRVSDKPFFKL